MSGNSLIRKKNERAHDHLQNEVSNTPNFDKDKDSTTLRVSMDAAEVVKDLKYSVRYKSDMQAVDEIIRIYKKYKHLEEQD